MKHCILFGIQGSGKGTQAQLLRDHMQGQFAYFAPGDVFRAITSGPNALGDYVTQTLASGQLIDDAFTIALFRVYIQTLGSRCMLLDGYPRSIGQLHDLRDFMGNTPLIGINLELDRDSAIERMLSRGRADDTLPVIEKRIAEYTNKTAPMISAFSEYFPCVSIDASLDMETVSAYIRTAIA